MSDVLERVRSDSFARPKMLATLQRQTFTLDELAAAFRGLPFPAPRLAISDTVSRHRVSLVSERGAPRQFHVVDAYSVALFLALDRELARASTRGDRPALRAKLRAEVQHLTWGGDAMTPAEAAERKAEFRVERTRALKRGGRAAKANDQFIFDLHEQRRRELQRDIFAAPPCVWARDADRHFVAFMRRDIKLYQALIDRNGPDAGLINVGPLVDRGITGSLDLTAAFGLVDELLAELVDARGARAAKIGAG